MTPERLEQIRSAMVRFPDHQTYEAELLAEVDRLRAAVEAVRALPRIELEPRSGVSLMLLGQPLTVSVDFHAVDLADVLRILEATDGD